MQSYVDKLKRSSLFKDSFWAVFGNGLGSALLLFSGIIIARFLGKDIYGEYGMVKTTMFHMGSLATLGLNFTATKYIAQYVAEDNSKLRGIVWSSIKITLIFSSLLCLLLVIFARQISEFVNAPELATPFRFLGILIICRALYFVSAALLGGFKAYKGLGINNIIAGTAMLFFSIIFTYFFGLVGSLIALFSHQLLLCLLNFIRLRGCLVAIGDFAKDNFDKELLLFTFPVALQELVYFVAQWGSSLAITKYASLGEMGIYSACAQWNAVILFIPGFLSNVVLSYLSTSATDNIKSHGIMVKRMLAINFVCSIIPFFTVAALSPLIVSFYGDTFSGMQSVLNILVFSTVFACVSNVFQNDLLSRGRNWILFLLRAVRDLMLLVSLIIVLKRTDGNHAALSFAIINVAVACFFLLVLAVYYIISTNKEVRK